MPADQTTSKGKGFTKSTSQISFEIIHESGEYCNIESARPSSSSSLKKFGTEEQEFLTLLDIVAKRLVHGITAGNDRSNPIAHEVSERDLIDLPNDPMGVTGLKQALDFTLSRSVNTWSGRFFDKLYAGSNSVGCLSELVIGFLNTNVHVYHVSPIFTRIELRMCSELGKLFGFEEAGGVFCPGGSYSNMHAMLTARNVAFPDFVKAGVNGKRLVVFTSSHCHYSVMKSAIALGVGLDNVICIKTDERGLMCTTHLEHEIQEALQSGAAPFMVNATAGTTVYGAFDPLVKISEICAKYSLWFHIDGSWGGAAVFSDEVRHLMQGCSKADSITFNPHKMLGVPLLCSALLTKKPNILDSTQCIRAPYLFHSLRDGITDMGNRTLGCSRRADSLKLYLSWIYYGKSGFAARVKKAVANARGFSDELKNYNSPTGGRFKLVLRESQYTNVCFWYIPRTKLSKIDPSTIDSSKIESVPRELGEITRVIHSKLIARGRVMVDYMTVQNPEREELPYFFRMVFINPKVQMADYHLVLQEIDSIGSAIYYE